MKAMNLIRTILLIGLLAGIVPIQAWSQDNIFHITDSLYPIYQRAFQLRHEPIGIRIADTLYRKAVKANDPRAQCMALTIPVQYYFNLGDCLKAKKAAERLRTVARENRLLPYYHFAYLYIENADLQTEQIKQNAENKQLMLDNQELEIEHLKMESDLQKAEVEKQRAEAEWQKSEAERHKTLLERQQARSKYRITLFSTIIFFLLLFIAFLMYYLYHKRKITNDLREKNEELIIARDAANAANKMKSEFIQNMSHEIRTPLNAIVGFSSVILDSELELSKEERQQFGELIQHNSNLLTTIINDILHLSELESGHYVLELGTHSCNEMCKTAIATVTHRKPEKVKLYYTSEVDENYQITTDRQRVEQVLINFLTNAEKHTDKGEIHLHCSLSENPGCVTFSVTDTGEGVPKSQAEAIFERFKKLDSFKQGTGLGLNICRLIAERLNGSVSLDSSYTQGARFLFILPISAQTMNKLYAASR